MCPQDAPIAPVDEASPQNDMTGDAISDMTASASGETALGAAPINPLASSPPAKGPNPRFLGFLAICLVAHAALLAFLLRQDSVSALLAPPVQEIPVEVVVEPPPEPAPPPTPQQPEPPQPKAPEAYEKPATDAPRAANKEKIERESAAEQTKSSRVAPQKPDQAVAPTPPKEKSPAQESAPQPAPESAAAPPVETQPDAETIARAETKPQPIQEQDQTKAETKAPATQGEKSVAEQIASLTPLPDYELGAAAAPSPVSGGKAKPGYLSTLYGLIMPHMRVPATARAARVGGKGVVTFYIDEGGHLVHQAVYRSSGVPELDMAALAAVRSAAPFPPPPPGLPHALQFTYTTR
jgi:protein TonB